MDLRTHPSTVHVYPFAGQKYHKMFTIKNDLTYVLMTIAYMYFSKSSYNMNALPLPVAVSTLIQQIPLYAECMHVVCS